MRIANTVLSVPRDYKRRGSLGLASFVLAGTSNGVTVIVLQSLLTLHQHKGLTDSVELIPGVYVGGESLNTTGQK